MKTTVESFAAGICVLPPPPPRCQPPFVSSTKAQHNLHCPGDIARPNENTAVHKHNNEVMRFSGAEGILSSLAFRQFPVGRSARNARISCAADAMGNGRRAGHRGRPQIRRMIEDFREFVGQFTNDLPSLGDWVKKEKE